jgi:hypothetical protein
MWAYLIQKGFSPWKLLIKKKILNKNLSYLCDREHEYIIYMIYSQFVIKIYLYLKYNIKKYLKYIFKNYKPNSQNDTCHMQSLEKDFYLGALNSFASLV